MPTVQHVKARKDYPNQGIKKGEMYYTWSINFGGTYRSKTPPQQSQLTTSEFLRTLYAAQESVGDMKPTSYATCEDVAAELEQIKSDLEQLKEETEEKLNNMPEGLQQGSTGELLQERIDNLDSLIGEFDSLDTDFNGPGTEEEVKDEPRKGESKADCLKRLHQERIAEILEEVQGFSWF